LSKVIARQNDMTPPMAVWWEHIDSAATWRMFLKRRRRRLCCCFGHFPRGHPRTRQPVPKVIFFL